MSNSLNLELPYVQGAQAQKHVTVNDALRRIDSVVQLTVEDRNRSAPPSGPQEGDRHIVAASPTGGWVGHPFEVAAYQDGAWVFFTPKEGWIAYNLSENALLYFDGASWEIFTAVGAAETSAKLGINATADDSKRLFVESEYVVFSHDSTAPVPTGNAQVVINKALSADTASHLFQRNFIGHAELGLVGSNSLSLKVSNNGSDWNESFSVLANNGIVDFNRVPRVGGLDGFLVSFESRTVAEASDIPGEIGHIEVRGYYNETRRWRRAIL
jgi:hypothetical protein